MSGEGRARLAVELLAELVSVASVNPPGQEYEAVQAVVAGWLRRFGIEPEIHRVNGKPNVVARVGSGSPVALVNGHVDVVPADPASWSRPPFRLTAEGGRLYGRGTADMKGGLAALLVAVGEWARRGGTGRGTVVFTSTVDEETGGADGLGALLASGALGVEPDWALVAEPTENEVTTCEKGVLRQLVRVRGKAAHAAAPELGLNAIEVAAAAVLGLRGLMAQAQVAREPHPLLGGPTLAVGLIRGGVASNVVAEACEFTLDRRILPGEEVGAVREAIRRAVEAAAEGAGGAGPGSGLGPVFTFEDLVVAEPFETHPGAAIVRAAQAAVASVRGRPAALRGLAGFTDARYAARRGIPAILLGPGSIRQAHQADEFVEESQLRDAVEIFGRLLEGLHETVWEGAHTPMGYEIRMPKLSATMEEATVVRWLKRPGDYVAAGEPLVEIETDKSAIEVEALESGRLTEILVGEGEGAAVGQVLARLEGLPVAPATPATHAAPAPAPPADRILATPAAKRLARASGLDLASVRGTGPEGRITAEDVERALAARAAEGTAPGTGPESVSEPQPKGPPPVGPQSTGRPAADAMRRAVAEQVSRSRREIPSFWTERWVALAGALAVREEANRQGAAPRITFTDLLLQAMAEVLPQHVPLLRSASGESQGPATEINVGLVISVPGGIQVATLPGLAGKSLREIARARSSLVEAVRAGRLPQSALAPATITLSNVGASGADRFEAIIYPGQTAILAVGRIHDRVVPRGRAFSAEPGCYLVLSVDHRVVDGLEASAFIGALAERIEQGPWRVE